MAQVFIRLNFVKCWPIFFKLFTVGLRRKLNVKAAVGREQSRICYMEQQIRRRNRGWKKTASASSSWKVHRDGAEV